MIRCTEGERLPSAWDATGPRASEHRRRMRRTSERPFIGVDGEGWGVDAYGRQHYMLMCAGDAELWTGSPLATAECIEFLLSLPPSGEAVLVGFSFGYDATMILRDLPGERDPAAPDRPPARERLLAERDGNRGYVWWGDYGIDYLPRNHLRVCRSRWNAAARRREAVPGTSRTVYETFGFFQCSFVRALRGYGIGGADGGADAIDAMKAARGGFSEGDADAVRAYCRSECGMLAALMSRFRDICLASDPPLRPRTWNGAGKLAGALHAMHGTLEAAELAQRVPPGALEAARHAYYGGRFETTASGAVPGPVYSYDIRSAYPAGMRSLPCLVHGTWRRAAGGELAGMPPGSLYVAPVAFGHAPPAQGRRNLCGLPFRLRSGKLCWPVRGRGTYWSTEIEAARELGCEVRYAPSGGWAYECRCDGCPFAWVESLYDYRRTLSKAEGMALKLAINSLYGRLAQRIGKPRWANLIWAGLVTASARAALCRAAAHAPGDILMMATDGIYSRSPLPLDTGERLGQWEAEEHPGGMFVVQPGLYWPLQPGPLPPPSDTAVKSRGVSPTVFGARRGAFESAWHDWMAPSPRALPRGDAPPVVPVEVPLFTGLRLAQARGAPMEAGRWSVSRRDISMAWQGKRGAWEAADGHVRTFPVPGNPLAVSKPHGDDNAAAMMDAGRAEAEEQYDHIDLF